MNRPIDFGPLAAEYEQFRVGYSAELYEFIAHRLSRGPVGPGLDLACGTGLSTEPLVRLATGPVFGSDVAAELIARAPKSSGDVAIRYFLADATQLPCAEASMAFATCAQALHWIAPERVLPEVHRVLKPGGWFFAYWKYPHADEPYQRIADLILSDMHGRTIEQGYSLQEPPDFRLFGFASFERTELEFDLPYTLESYVGFMRSRKRIVDLAGDRLPEFLSDYRLELEKRISAHDEFIERNVAYLFAGVKAPGE